MHEIKDYLIKWNKNEMEDASMAIAFFLFYHEKKYPNKKLKMALEDEKDFSSLLEKFVFKKVRPKALTTLIKWHKGEWDLKLLNRILTPYEILSYQAQGIRPVTIKFQKEFSPILHKEDCLEFFLHDLEHAYMFFYDDELKKMQIEFFRKIEESLKTDLWAPYLSKEDFKERFHYLISDMNTHKEHYRQFLNSMLMPSDIEKFSYLFF